MKSPVQIAPVRMIMWFAIFASSAIAQQKPAETTHDMSVCPMHVQKAAETNPDMSVCPMHVQSQSSPEQHHQGVVKRGDEVMGFSHEKTTHHFRLYADGGGIEAEAKDAQDTARRDQIRSHFGHIVTMFAAGNFSAPMLIHEQNPPGAETMKRLRDLIQYKLETTEKGGRIRITTKDAEALRAVHEFLRFQIDDHQTGDSTEVTKTP